ncbi:unnamed protein product [Ectocarpus sp. 4 AP-2014]
MALHIRHDERPSNQILGENAEALFYEMPKANTREPRVSKRVTIKFELCTRTNNVTRPPSKSQYAASIYSPSPRVQDFVQNTTQLYSLSRIAITVTTIALVSA